jgi:hypothetical protein
MWHGEKLAPPAEWPQKIGSRKLFPFAELAAAATKAARETSKPAKSPGILLFRAVDGCHGWRTLAPDGILGEFYWLRRSTLLCVRVDFFGPIDAVASNRLVSPLIL